MLLISPLLDHQLTAQPLKKAHHVPRIDPGRVFPKTGPACLFQHAGKRDYENSY
jgi:hypothetical protein